MCACACACAQIVKNFVKYKKKSRPTLNSVSVKAGNIFHDLCQIKLQIDLQLIENIQGAVKK